MKDICQIYVIRNTVNEKVYVGQTWGSLEKRLRRHAKESKCPKINRAIQKYGQDNFTIEPILTVWSQEEADASEIQFINQFNSIANGYNIKLGGDGGKHSEETKRKIQEANTGMKRSPEACHNISLGKLGAKNPMFGKQHSEEHKRNLSESMKGMHNGGSFSLGHTNSVGSKHAQAKLDEAKVTIIKQMLESGITEPAIAKQFNVTRSAIAAINQGRSWKHVIL